jgi:hypothetical protein
VLRTLSSLFVSDFPPLIALLDAGFAKIARGTGVGFLIMGFIGFFW